MPTLTIPKAITKGAELVVLPREEYEFLRSRKSIPMVPLTAGQKRDLEEARKEYRKGQYVTLKEFKRGLGGTAKRKS